ncbi:MAG: M20/M25/M40 family metallo-hydrolase, partial [Ignavibacteriae bacterium]|nr:M20/M25/M40 family metallo-hydrolase [Ignavibacteriota bacterium]
MSRRLSVFILLSLFASQGFAQRGTPVPQQPAKFLLDVDPAIQQLVQMVDSARINSTLRRLEAFRSRHITSDSLAAAKNWIIGKFQEYGYTDVVQHAFTHSGRSLHNIVVTKAGTRYPNKLVLLISHYDAISETPSTLAPGVNDNGTGVALTLEVARILAAKQLDYTIRFICFSAEEQGLIGSANYVSTVVVPQNHDIKLVINVDEIGGYRGNTNTMVKVERDEDNNPSGNNAASAAMTDTLAALTRTYSTLTTTITNAYGSDYMSFEDRGYVITGFYEGIATPHYHKSTDTFANLDPPYVFQIVKAAVAGVAHFGGVQRKFLNVSHVPAVSTQDTSRSIQLDAEIMTSSSVRKASVVYRTQLTPTFAESTMTQIAQHGDTLVFRGWIPKQSYGATVSYFLRITSNDSLAATFPQDTTAPLVFSVLPDTIAPTITHAVLPNRSWRDAPYDIQASLADANGIANAWVTFRVNGGPDSVINLTQLTANIWRGFIASSVAAGHRIEYKISARDRSFSSNVGTLPASGWYSFRVLNSLLYDFEGTNAGFTPTNDWQWGTIGTPDIPAPPVGVRVWATNLAGNYSGNTTSTLLSPVIDLHNKAEIVFTFKHFYNIEPQNDGGNVAVAVDGGAFQLLTPEGGYPFASIVALGGPGYSGNSFTWKDARFNIASLQNHAVQFRFVFASDLLTNQRGWYVDDVRIDYLDMTTADVSNVSNVPHTTELYQNYPNPFNPT